MGRYWGGTRADAGRTSARGPVDYVIDGAHHSVGVGEAANLVCAGSTHPGGPAAHALRRGIARRPDGSTWISSTDSRQGQDLALPYLTTPTSLELPEGLPLATYMGVLDTLGRVDRASSWWIGDALVASGKTYGDTYTEAAAAAATELSITTLRRLKEVAEKVVVNHRFESLSHTHHEQVAFLDPEEQTEWLDQAFRENWTVAELRKAIRESKWEPLPPPPTGESRCVVWDPATPESIAADKYHLQTREEILEEPLPLAGAAHCWMWTTEHFLPFAFEVLAAHGLRYLTTFTWHKGSGMVTPNGIYTSEFLLFAKTEEDLPVVEGWKGTDLFEKPREHSRKPECSYELIRKVSPGPRIELNSRTPREGFEVHGNDVDTFPPDTPEERAAREGRVVWGNAT